MKPLKLLLAVAAISVLVGLVWRLPAQASHPAGSLHAAVRPRATPVPVMPAAPPRLERLEWELLTQLNAARADGGLQPLTPDAQLVAVARDRSADMLARDYFAHITPEGTDVYAMMDARGIHAPFAGENLARNNWDDRQSAAHAVAGFLASPPHRHNMLDPKFTRIGVGVAVGEDGMKIYTVLFAGDSP